MKYIRQFIKFVRKCHKENHKWPNHKDTAILLLFDDFEDTITLCELALPISSKTTISSSLISL